MAVEIGDLVHVRVEGNGVAGHEAYVIGWPDYSKGLGDVVMLATEQYAGAPYHVGWCTPLGCADAPLAKILGDRYEAAYPGRLRRPTLPPAGDR